MDPELREYLEAMRREMVAGFERVDRRITEETGSLRGEMVTRFEEETAALRDEMVTGYDALHREIQEGDRQTRAIVESVRDEVRGVADGVTMVREMLNRSQEEQNSEIDLRRAPLEAAVLMHSSQIQDHERRIHTFLPLRSEASPPAPWPSQRRPRPSAPPVDGITPTPAAPASSLSGYRWFSLIVR